MNTPPTTIEHYVALYILLYSRIFYCTMLGEMKIKAIILKSIVTIYTVELCIIAR